MYYVLIVLHNFRQIALLGGQNLESIQAKISHLAISRGGILESDRPGAWIFGFNSERERAQSLLSEFLFMTKDTLETHKDDIRDYSIILEKLVTDPFLIQKRLQRTFLLTPMVNKIWTSSSSADFLKTFLPLENNGELWEISGPVKFDPRITKSWEVTAKNLSWYQDLQSWDFPIRKNSHYLIQTTYPEVMSFILRWYETAFPGNYPMPVFFAPNTMKDYLYPLIFGLDPEISHRLGEGLELEDLSLLEDNSCWKTLISSQGLNYPGENIESDLVKALVFWLKTWRALSPTRPGVLLVMEPSLWELRTRALLGEVFNHPDILSHWSILVVEKPGVPGAWNLPFKKIVDWTGMGWESPEKNEAGSGLIHYLRNLPTTFSHTVLRSAPLHLHKILYLMGQSSGLLNTLDVIQILSQIGEDPHVIGDMVERLLEEGLILLPMNLILANESWKRSLGLQPEDETKLNKILGIYLFQKWKDNSHPFSEAYAEVLLNLGFYSEGLRVLESYLQHKINRNQGDFLTILRQKSLHEGPVQWKNQLTLLAASSKLRYALNQGGRIWEPRQLANFAKHFLPTTPWETHGEWLLQCGRFHLGIQGIQEGFTFIKKAYMVAQGQDNISLQVRSGLELGLVFLRKGRNSEAWEYFEMTGRLADSHGLHREKYMAGIYESVARFLWGNISGALEVLEKISKQGSKTGLHSWKVYFLLLRGRELFDLGKYDEALVSFDQGVNVTEIYGIYPAQGILFMWKARSLAYAGRTQESLKILNELPSSPERNLFLSEVYFFMNEEIQAMKILDSMVLRGTEPLSQSSLDWTSGFAMIEDLCLSRPGEDGVLTYLIRGFRSFLYGRNGRSGEGVTEFQRLVSEKKVTESNPYIHHLHYWWSYIMPRDGLDQAAFHSTILGKGLKDLQTRGSRILNRDDRYSYLQKSYWNAAYLREGKKFKLA